MKNQTEFEKALTSLIFQREGYIFMLGRPMEDYESDMAWIQTLDIAIDAMQFQKSVVRCGDCKFYNKDVCTVRFNISGYEIQPTELGYCSKGEPEE